MTTDFKELFQKIGFVLVLVVFPLAAFAEDELTTLRQENASLRAEVDRLRRAMATGQTCGAEADATIGHLMGKLADGQRAQALGQLGLGPGPLMIPDDLLGAFVPGEYIVLTDVPLRNAAQVAAQFGIGAGQVLQVYRSALSGFAARLSDAERDRITGLPGVQAVARNGYVFVAGAARPKLPSQPQTLQAIPVQQSGAAPIDVYLFDTGIRQMHSDLRGQVRALGYSYFDNGLQGEDCSGHGTHVAALIAGRTLGMSKRARLVSVKVIDRFGTGDVATVIAGIDWVMAQPGATKLVNMSLTRRVVEPVSPLDIAVSALIETGATVVVAAGNAASDVSDFTPARVPGAVTVGSALGAALSPFSNAGTGVDIYAPGEKVLSASIRDVCGVQAMSGTSMAAPIVTGLMADLMAQGLRGDAALRALQLGAEQVNTGAYEGERERFVLSVTMQDAAALCDRPPLVVYDDGIKLGAE